jgi:hypothetical protein
MTSTGELVVGLVGCVVMGLYLFCHDDFCMMNIQQMEVMGNGMNSGKQISKIYTRYVYHRYQSNILYWLNTSTNNGYCPVLKRQNDNKDNDMA